MTRLSEEQEERYPMQLILPPLYQFQIRENGNDIRQLAVPSWNSDGSVDTFHQGRLKGFLLSLSDGSPPVLLLSTPAPKGLDYPRVLRLNGFNFDPRLSGALDLTQAKWLRHPEVFARFSELNEFERNADETRSTWRDAFYYKRADHQNNIEGLRSPQLGAIYAVQSHWTVSNDPATVVLPTGVGKTETMMSLLVLEQCQRLLVVVPTDALRYQISEKMLSLGLLKTPKFQVVSEKARYPVVGVLNRRPKTINELELLFRKCNVIVTTMALASQCTAEVRQRMATLCSHLFIDEAHHIAAPRWKEFKEGFRNTRIVQFTATPFRNDDQPIDGKRIFTFPLRNAQEQGYFQRIQFKPVVEFDPANKDATIAKAAVEQLREDNRFGHILMARTANVARAAEVFEYYREYVDFNPVQIHAGISSKAERDEVRRKLISGESRIVVCVDMLGEGFDLPELKIAAFHDIRKSLAVTLQLAGRFTRSKPDLGNATFVANVADLEVRDELKRLYQHDSDWNRLVPLLSEKATEGELDLWEFLKGFQELPEELTLQNVRPAMSFVVYRTQCAAWTPEAFQEGIPGYKLLDREYHALNPHENTLVVVSAKRMPVEWAQIDEIHTWDWQLYVLHWDKDNQLLFIHNSSNAGFFKRLAEAVAGNVVQVRGREVFRCLSGIGRLKLQNVGLLEQLGRLIRYTMRAGSDVESGIPEAQKQRAIKSNLFGQGFENGQRTTIGCSYKGRIWSYRTTNLMQLTNWCRDVGAKLTDLKLDPDEVLRGTLVPQMVTERPEKTPISVEWPDVFYKEPEKLFAFQIGNETFYPHNAELQLVTPTDSGPLNFEIAADLVTAQFCLALCNKNGVPDYSIEPLGRKEAIIRYRGRAMQVQEFFDEHPPVFWFADGSSLSGNEYVELRNKPSPFPIERIDELDWTGTNIRCESQGVAKDQTSIQHRVIRELRQKSFSVLFDDDGKGESADVVGIREQVDHIEVEFWHCKFSSMDHPGSRVKDLYELCGQAQKSVRWLEKPRDLFTHLLRREPLRLKDTECTRYEVGNERDLLRIREKTDSQRVLLRVFIVQPGISKSAVSREQLELLAVTENYLLETFAVPFGVVANA